MSGSYIYSTSASIDGIYKFDILWGNAEGFPVPALGYFSGSAEGFQFGTYFLLPPFNLPARLAWNASPNAGQWTVSAVPEPGSFAMLALGLTGLMGWSARQRRADRA